jgi:hypothetical protein
MNLNKMGLRDLNIQATATRVFLVNEPPAQDEPRGQHHGQSDAADPESRDLAIYLVACVN